MAEQGNFAGIGRGQKFPVADRAAGGVVQHLQGAVGYDQRGLKLELLPEPGLHIVLHRLALLRPDRVHLGEHEDALGQHGAEVLGHEPAQRLRQGLCRVDEHDREVGGLLQELRRTLFLPYFEGVGARSVYQPELPIQQRGWETHVNALEPAGFGALQLGELCGEFSERVEHSSPHGALPAPEAEAVALRVLYPHRHGGRALQRAGLEQLRAQKGVYERAFAHAEFADDAEVELGVPLLFTYEPELPEQSGLGLLVPAVAHEQLAGEFDVSVQFRQLSEVVP